MDTLTSTTVVASMFGPGLAAGAVCRGLAVAILAAQIVRVVFRNSDREAGRDGWRAERLAALRRGSRVFRWLEPYVVELSELPVVASWCRAWQIQKRLDAGGLSLPWKPQELLALWTVQGLLAGLAAVFVSGPALSWPAKAVLLSVSATGVIVFRYWQFTGNTTVRLLRIQQRLPYAIDLMALMMEAGAGFKESFTAVVRESRGHPLGDEFAKVLHEIECGQTLSVALQGLADRLHSDEVSELTLTVQTAEELGAPLSATFLDLADRMRIKRSLWAEKRAGEAKASITFPGVVIMVACLLIVVAPFILQAVYDAQIL